jgi:hypothetical protein
MHIQTGPLGQTFIKIIDDQEKICANLKLTTQVHILLVLTISSKIGCLLDSEQTI